MMLSGSSVEQGGPGPTKKDRNSLNFNWKIKTHCHMLFFETKNHWNNIITVDFFKHFHMSCVNDKVLNNLTEKHAENKDTNKHRKCKQVQSSDQNKAKLIPPTK